MSEKQKTIIRLHEASNPKRNRTSLVFAGILASSSPPELIMNADNGKEPSMKLHEKIKSTWDVVSGDCKASKPAQKFGVVTRKTDFTFAIQIASLEKKSQIPPES